MNTPDFEDLKRKEAVEKIRTPTGAARTGMMMQLQRMIVGAVTGRGR